MYVWKEAVDYPVEIGLEHPYLQQWTSTRMAAQQQVQLEKSKLLPSWSLGYQHYPATPMNIAFLGGRDAKAYVLMAGWSLPLFTRGQVARVKVAKQGVQYVQANFEAEQSRWLSNYRIAFADYIASKNNLNQYENSLLPDARQILQLSAQQYKQGNISYLEWLLLAQQNLQTVITYWHTLPVFNQRALELHYLNTNN
jgi:cobalt-zinc-cadmium resistance protein CzcA